MLVSKLIHVSKQGHWLQRNWLISLPESPFSINTWVWTKYTIWCSRQYSRAFSLMKSFVHWLTVHWNLFIPILGIYSLSGKTSYRRVNRCPGSVRTNLVRPQSGEIGCYNYRIALKFDRHFNSATAALPVKFQSVWKSLNPNLAASRLHEILR